MRCLIVDDSAEFRRAARVMLERGGFTVVGAASTGAEAVALALAQRPDLALLDIDLGGQSGFDVADDLHRMQSPPVTILISTHAEQDFEDLIEASPALGFLPKFALSAEAITGLLAGRAAGGSPVS